MTDASEPLWNEPAQGSPWDPALIGMPGLDRLRAYVRGELPVPPIQYLTGVVPVEVGVGTMTYAMPASRWLMGGTGGYLGGTFALLADVALASAIISGLPAGLALTTQELSLHFLRRAGPESERLVAHGHIIHGGRSIGLSEVHIHDAQGRLLSYGSSRCVTVPVGPLPPRPPPPNERPPAGWVPPLDRPVRGGLAPAELWSPDKDGLTLCKIWEDASFPMPPLGHLFGLRFAGSERGSGTMTMPASGWLANAAGTAYGGALAVLADIALDYAATTVLPAGQSFKSLDLKVNFLRPVRPDGRLLTARAHVFHHGKQMIVANGDIVDADGRQVIVATGTRMILAEPFRP